MTSFPDVSSRRLSSSQGFACSQLPGSDLRILSGIHYLQKLQKWIPDRILKSDPGNCEQANPCEELNLREETSGNEVILVTEILQKPVVNSASIIPHNPLRTQ